MIPIKPIPATTSVRNVDGQQEKQAQSASRTQQSQQAQSDSMALSEVPAVVQQNYLSPGAINLLTLPPLSLYIHFPWCVKKCPYCDFNSHEVKNQFDENAYLDAVRADLEAALPMIWGRKIYSVFIGGGTPSLMSATGLDRLLSDVRTLLPLDSAAEITMEANPGTFEAEKFKQYRASGINRLSIGIQSFNAYHLSALGRIHNGDEAQRAIAIAQDNFENFNLDLMFALPNQTLAESIADLELALKFAPNHLSLYHLTLEPNTYFAKFPPAIPDDDLSAEMQEQIQVRMAAAGYEHYEVSAFSKPGKASRHNLNYWNFGDYLGVGAGAHSKLSFPHRIIRQVRHKQPKMYMEAAKAGNFLQENYEIAKDELAFEFMLNALRLNAGFDTSLFYERTGLLINSIEAALNQAESKKLLIRDHLKIQPTALGRNFLNDLQQMFL